MKKYKAKILKNASDTVGKVSSANFFVVKWSGRDLLLTGYGKGDIAKEIEPEAEYELKVPFIQECSVKKELKRRMKKGGFQEVANYLEKFT